MTNDTQQTTPELYEYYIVILGEEPTSIDNFKDVEIHLGRDGFAQTKESVWRCSDAQGVLEITAWPRMGYFQIAYTPKTAGPFGDAALAALIARAERIYLDSADSIQLTFPPRLPKRGGRQVEVAAHLHFKLNGGAWWQTTCTIQWSK